MLSNAPPQTFHAVGHDVSALAPRRGFLSRAGLLGLASALPALLATRPAAAIESPSGAVVLSLSGQVRHTNGRGSTDFDMAMLESLPQVTLSTHTPWFNRSRRFTGPLLREVLRAAGAHGSMLHARALNDYHVDIPFDDAQRLDVVVARLLDGAPMRVRDRGPLFIMYPFDAMPDLRNAVYYSRCIWQLRAIDVR